MIYANRLRDFLEQDCLAHSWRRDDETTLPVSERRQQVDRPRADRIRLWIFQHDPALRKLRRQFVEVGRLHPLLRWLALDRYELFKREKFLAITRKPYRSGNLLAWPQVILVDHCARNADIFRNRQKV